jgi:hypothetical protein
VDCRPQFRWLDDTAHSTEVALYRASDGAYIGYIAIPAHSSGYNYFYDSWGPVYLSNGTGFYLRSKSAYGNQSPYTDGRINR